MLFIEKIKMMNIYNKIYSPDLKKNLVFIPSEETSKYFSACYLGVKDFLKYLHNYPEIMYKIIKSSDKKYFTYHFNNFILDNFYEDILSPKSISKDFMSIIEHLFKDIISKLDNPSDFIKDYENSNLSYLLDGLLYKREVQIYFNSILSSILEEYAISEKSSKVILFDMVELNNFIKNRETNYKHLMRNSDLNLNKKKQIEKKKKEQNNVLNNIFRMRFHSYEITSIESLNEYEEEVLLMQNSQENAEFLTKYLQELNKDDLKKILQSKEIKEDKYLKEYVQFQLSTMDKNEDFFSNKRLLEKVQKSKESEKLLYFYERNFMITISIIHQILERIKNAVHSIPPIIRYILKVLADLLRKKFQNIKKNELYSNLGAVIIKLINNLFSNLEYNLLLSKILINKRIKRNLNIILSIFSQLISLKFYNSQEKSDYTPFNLYFLDKCQVVYDIYDKILDFNITEESIHRKLSIKKIFHFHNNKNANIETNINSPNKEKLFYSISICYNVESITTLLNIIKHNISYIFEDKSAIYPVDEFRKIYDKLKDNKEVFKSLKERDSTTINYYIYFEIIFSNSFNDLISNKKLTPIFMMEKVENKNNSKKENRKNEFISALNLFIELLMNLPELDTIDIKINNNNSIKQIMNDISLYLQHNHNIMDNFNTHDLLEDSDPKMKIPLEWYINSLSKSMEKMDDKYKKKEYEKFFVKFKKAIENSIEGYRFDYIGQLSESLNFMMQYKEEYIEISKIFREINLNSQIIEFINNEIIEVEMRFKYDEKEKFFEINKKKKNVENNEHNLFLDNSQICYNILEFTQNFPDLISIQRYFNVYLFELEKTLKVYENLNVYFSILNEKISNKFSEEIREKALIKIRNYIFEKLYLKTFPKYTEVEDQKLLNKISTLFWIKPINLNFSGFDFEMILPIITNLFIHLDKQRSPSGKLNIINKMFETIFNALKYIKGEHFSNEDILNICEYIIIKAKPEKLYSNLKYLDTFENKDIFDNNKIYLKLLKESVEKILNSNHKSFKGISELDFNKKCKGEDNKFMQNKI